MIWLKRTMLNVKDFITRTGGVVPGSVPIDLFLKPGEIVMKTEDTKFIEGSAENAVTAWEEAEVLSVMLGWERRAAINIKDKQPIIGQRCNVYDEKLQEWLYAHWSVDRELGIYTFKEWAREGDRNVRVTWWLPERDKPKNEGEE